MKLILIILFVSNNIFSQKAYNDPKSHLTQDSIDYYSGMKYYKQGKMKKARNTLIYIFFGGYNKWSDSTKKFIREKGKTEWLNLVSEYALNGYTFQDSMYWVEGKKLFESEEYKECRMHFERNRNYEFSQSIFRDSAEVLKKMCSKILDSLYRAELEDKKKMERKWVYLGIYEQFNKYGEYNGDDMTYFDENNLLFEGDSVCVVIKSGDDYFGDYRYVSLNLKTLIVHGIDASFIRNGRSYNYIWDGDWWNTNSGFGDDLYKAVIKYKN